MPQLGATFVPGGYDDYYMPEVVAPAPQRVMPEVPQHMQDDLQRMELEAREISRPRPDSSTTASSMADQYTRHPAGEEYVQYIRAREARAAEQDSADLLTAIASLPREFRPFTAHPSSASAVLEAPSFSPFPTVAGENIPPTDEHKGEILWNAREHVLNSNNVPMQVSWARDTLMWVEIAAERQERDLRRDGKGKDRPQTPKMEHELRVDAVNIIEYLAQQGHPDATFMKAKWQEFGKFGYRENKRDAYVGYKKAAELGFGRAEYRMGMLYENSNDSEKAVRHYQQGVQLQDSASYYRLGMLHLMGQLGHSKDYEQGLLMIQKAADRADEDAPQGAYVYGMLIARELPDIIIPEGMLPFELVMAKQYIEKAAYLGFAKAQLKMGQAHELSQLGCDFSPAHSLHYYGLAAHQGQPEAALGVSRWFLFGFEGVFPKNEQLAYKYAQEAANANLATGEFAMGYYYEIGIHVPKDVREARRWYELAAEHGNKDARARIDSLSQSKTLTKQDHETTTLTRIKSQHGSQRGKRPDRFTKANEVLPSLAELDNPPSVPAKQGHLDFAEPARLPAFTVNLDGSNLAMRPKSAAPYPEDDRPPPLNVRPRSTAPYPEDDHPGHKPPLSPHYNPGIRPSAGPQADRPMSAFGIRPTSPNASADYRGRPTGHPAGSGSWEPQLPSGYRQPSPGPGRQDPYRMSGAQQLPPQPALGLPGPRMGQGPGPGGNPVVDPTRNRLQRPNPNPSYGSLPPAGGAPQGPPQMGGYGMEGGAQPGRDYGPRTSSRPVSEVYDRYGAGPPAHAGGRLPPAGANIRPERLDSLNNRPDYARMSSAGQAPPKARPPHLDPMAGRSSAPPAQGPRPGISPGPSPGVTSPASVASTTNLPGHAARPAKQSSNHPDGKTIGQGPATFEEMGIPQGKTDSDCVVM